MRSCLDRNTPGTNRTVPGLVYRLDDPPVVVLLFGSGTTVIVGCKRLEDAETELSAEEQRRVLSQPVRDRLIDLGSVD